MKKITNILSFLQKFYIYCKVSYDNKLNLKKWRQEMNLLKTCTGCYQTKNIINFSKCRKNPDGLQYQCKDCNKITSAKFRELRPEYAGEWDKAHPGVKLSIANRWIENNYYKWYNKIKEINKSWGGGVYAIVNNITGDMYVGATRYLRSRKYQHFTKRGLKSNRNLAQAIEHYGRSNFNFYILENVDDDTLLLEREKAWIKQLDPSYNILKYI